MAHEVGFRHIGTVLAQSLLLEMGFAEVHFETLEIPMCLEEIPKLLSSVLSYVIPRSTKLHQAWHRYCNHGAAGFRLVHLQGLLRALERATGLGLEVATKPAMEVTDPRTYSSKSFGSDHQTANTLSRVLQ